MNSQEEQRQLDQVVERLAKKYSSVPADHVVDAVNTAYSRFDGSRIRDFVPLFVERIAHESLSTLVSQ
jgi:hypothetical protein